MDIIYKCKETIIKMHRIVKQLLVLKTHNAPNGCKKLTTCKDSTNSATRTFRSLLRAPIKTYEKHTHTHTHTHASYRDFLHSIVETSYWKHPMQQQRLLHTLSKNIIMTMWEVITLLYVLASIDRRFKWKQIKWEEIINMFNIIWLNI